MEWTLVVDVAIYIILIFLMYLVIKKQFVRSNILLLWYTMRQKGNREDTRLPFSF